MYRRLQANHGKTKEATYTADVAMKKGQLVMVDLATKEAKMPTAQLKEGLYIVDFDPAYEGMLAIENNVSDYDKRKNDIPADAHVALELLERGEEYATDQYVTSDTIVDGCNLEVDSTGKLKFSASDSPIKCTSKVYNDAGHTLLAYKIAESL